MDENTTLWAEKNPQTSFLWLEQGYPFKQRFQQKIKATLKIIIAVLVFLPACNSVRYLCWIHFRNLNDEDLLFSIVFDSWIFNNQILFFKTWILLLKLKKPIIFCNICLIIHHIHSNFVCVGASCQALLCYWSVLREWLEVCRGRIFFHLAARRHACQTWGYARFILVTRDIK